MLFIGLLLLSGCSQSHVRSSCRQTDYNIYHITKQGVYSVKVQNTSGNSTLFTNDEWVFLHDVDCGFVDWSEQEKSIPLLENEN